jgi:3',5'-cyclic AMP phosphodiesterase CpdA
MKRRYWGLVVGVAVAFSIYYLEYYIPYPVYSGEQLLNSDISPFTFVFFGDNRPSSEDELKENLGIKESGQPAVFATMVQLISEKEPLFVIGGGDYVLLGTPENFEEFLDVADRFEPPVFYTCGNHDDSPFYEHYLRERVYAFTYQNALFVILDNSDSYDEKIDRKQLRFLEEQLKKGAEHTFVFVHIPPFYPEGYAEPFGKIPLDTTRMHKMKYPEEFMEIILTYEVDYLFCSHIHAFYQERRGNTVVIISGGAGAPLIEGGYYHYIVVHVGDVITYTVVDVTEPTRSTDNTYVSTP